jgi:hypothetical protein
MDRGKLIAIITGVISIAIAIAYLILVQLIDFRGEMVPAPISYLMAIDLKTIDFHLYILKFFGN